MFVNTQSLPAGCLAVLTIRKTMCPTNATDDSHTINKSLLLNSLTGITSVCSPLYAKPD